MGLSQSSQLCPPSTRLQQEGRREGGTPLLKGSPKSFLGALFRMGHAVTKHKSPSVVSEGLLVLGRCSLDDSNLERSKAR